MKILEELIGSRTLDQKPMSKKRRTKSQGKADEELKKAADELDSDTWTVRPPDDLKEAVKKAMKATGSSRQALIFDCIRAELAKRVAEILEEQRKAQQFFESGGSEQQKP